MRISTHHRTTRHARCPQDLPIRSSGTQKARDGVLLPAIRLCAVLAATVATAFPAAAESTYGYNSAGTGTLTATGRVNLSVTVPKLILLRVGAASTVQANLGWTPSISIPAAPTTPATGNNTAVPWDGAAPTVAAGTQPGSLTVAAWTNAGAGTINCAVSTWVPATGGPPNSSFTVTATGSLSHPGANLGACASTSFGSNALASGTWAYVLGGTPASWNAGSYSATVTYTASGV